MFKRESKLTLFIPFMILICGVFACKSDLFVFINQSGFSGQFSGLKSLTLNEDGFFALLWDPFSGPSPAIYEIYVLKRENAAGTLALAAPMSSEDLLDNASGEVEASESPSRKGNLIATVQGKESFVWSEEPADPAMEYIFEVRSKFSSRASHRASQIVTSRVNFRDITSTAMALTYDSLNLSWPEVVGATSYQIFNMTDLSKALMETSVPKIALSFFQVSQPGSYCVKAVRGQMVSRSCFPIEGIGSSWTPKIINVTLQQPTGLYREGLTLDFEVGYSDAVYNASPRHLSLPFKLSSGGERQARYRRGEGSKVLVFSYDIASGDDTESLTIGESLINGGGDVLADVLGRSAQLKIAQTARALNDLEIDTQPPEVPLSVGFSRSITNAMSASLSWAGGGDRNFDVYKTRICESNDCETSCSVPSSSSQTSALFAIDDGKTYFGCAQALDKLGHASPWVSSLNPLIVDRTPARVVRVTSSMADGYYTSGAQLLIDIEFSKPVLVHESSTLFLNLIISGFSRPVPYISGSGTNRLQFRYSVAAGDTSSDLDIYSSSGLLIGGATSVRDLADNAANLTLPLPGSPNSLSGQKALIIDTTPPSSPSLSAFASNPSSSASIPLAWSGGTDNNFLQFRLRLCTDTSCSQSCIDEKTVTANSSSLLGVDGGTYYACVRSEDRAGLSSLWTASSNAIAVDTTPPQVSDVTAGTADGIYKAGDVLSLKVEFPEPVVVSGGLTLSLHLDGLGVAQYSAGSGSDTLTFTYTILDGDASADLDYLSVTSLVASGGVQVKDLAGNSASLALPVPGSSHSLSGHAALIVDTISPTPPSSVSVSSSTINPTIYAVGWTNSTDANFKKHSVKLCLASDCTSCLTSVNAALAPASLTGLAATTYYGCVRGEDIVGHETSWIASSGSVLVDNTPPAVVRVTSSTSSGAYAVGVVLPVQVRFSEPVFLSSDANLTLSLETGAIDRSLSLTSGDGSDTLVFHYTVQSGDESNLLDYVSAASLALLSGTVKDAAGNDALLSLPALGTSDSLAGSRSILIDTTAPTAPSLVSFAGATSLSSAVPISWTDSTDVNFKQHNIRLCPAANCTLACLSSQAAGSSPFTWTGVPDGTYYACVQGEDTASQKTAWVPSPSTIAVDSNAPTVVGITSSNPNGAYRAGTSLTVTVEFSEPVLVTNASQLTLSLANGVPAHKALYSAVSGKFLSFAYDVGAGDTSSDLDVASSSALTLGSGGAIKDSVGNNADIALPVGGSTNSLKSNKNLVIDTTSPLTSFQTPAANTAKAGLISVSLNCESGDSILISGDITPVINASCSGTSLSRTLYFSSGEGNKTITVKETDPAGNATTISRIFKNDNTAPSLSQSTAAQTTYSSQNTLTLGGLCEMGYWVIVSLSGSEDGRTSCISGSWSYDVAPQTTDGTRSYSLSQTDDAGNGTSLSVTWVRDTLTPTFLFSNGLTSMIDSVTANSYTFSGSCDSSSNTENSSIIVTGPGITGSATLACSSGSWSYATPVQGGSATFAYVFTQTDKSGNASVINGSWTRNGTGPNFTTASSYLKSKNDQVTFTGACDPNFPITVVSGPGSPVAPDCLGNMWSFPTPVASTDSVLTYVLAQENSTHDVTSLTLQFRRDATAPVMTSVVINHGATSTEQYRVAVDLKATDADSLIKSICLVQEPWPNSSTPPVVPSTPNASDSCWQTLVSIGAAGNKSITVNDLPYILNLTPGKYTLFGFAQDELGNRSAALDVNTQGKATIALLPATPVQLSILGLTDTSETSQSEFNGGDELDIHWNISAGSGLGATPISIRYATDDKTWAAVASNLANSSQGCTLLAGASGCYRLTVPTSAYMRLQIEVKNNSNNSYFFESSAINTGGKVRFVAGKTFKGIGGTALGFHLDHPNKNQLRDMDPGSFAVTRKGIIYIVDSTLGILKVDPSDQVVRVAFPRGTGSTADGTFNAATLKFHAPSAIYLDRKEPLQRMFVLDSGLLKIVDFNTNVLKTLTTSPDGTLNTTYKNLYATKSGIFGRSTITIGGLVKILPWYLDESTYQYKFFRFDVQNLPLYATTANTNCEYFSGRTNMVFSDDGTPLRLMTYLQSSGASDTYYNCRGGHIWNLAFPSSMNATYVGEEGGVGMPNGPSGAFGSTYTTGDILGLDGKTYAVGRYRGTNISPGIQKFDASNGTWTRILGLADSNSSAVKQMSCPDGTAALSCDVDLNAVFVDESGTVFFMDAGQIRVINREGKVNTIFGKAVKNLSSGQIATDTLLGSFVRYFQRRVDNGTEEVVISHHATNTYRSVVNGTLSILSGDGSNWPGANSGNIFGPAPGLREDQLNNSTIPFAMTADGTIYAGDYGAYGSQNGSVFRLDRTAGIWTILIPEKCTGCVAAAASSFDPLDASFNRNNPVQIYSNLIGAPTPNSTNDKRVCVKPEVFYLGGTKIGVLTQDPPIYYSGTTTSTYTNSNAYSMNTILSEFDAGTYNSAVGTVTNFRRVVGRQGAAIASARYSPTPSNSYGYLSTNSPTPTTPNQFELQSMSGASGIPSNTVHFQAFGSEWYMANRNFANKIIKVTSSTVTTDVTLDYSAAAFIVAPIGTDRVLFYCSATNGKLYRRNLTTPTTPAEAQVDLVIPGATCEGSTILHYTTLGVDYLMLIYKQNNLNGLIELKL